MAGGRGPSRPAAFPPSALRGSRAFSSSSSSLPLSPGPAERDPGPQRGPTAPPAFFPSLPPRPPRAALRKGRARLRGAAAGARHSCTAQGGGGEAAGGGLRAAAIAPSHPPIPKKRSIAARITSCLLLFLPSLRAPPATEGRGLGGG